MAELEQFTWRLALLQQRFGVELPIIQQALESQIRQAAEQGAQIVLLPELHQSVYFCQCEDSRNFDLAQSIPGPDSRWLSSLAKRHKLVLVGSLFEKRASGLYHNTAVVFDVDGEMVGRYRKMHVPDDPGYYEKYYFAPGDLGFKPIQTSVARLGVLVCWDQWFPEAARAMALHGAEILLYPTAIGWDRGDDEAEKQRQFESWQIVQRGHAIANGLPLAACNRTGLEQTTGDASPGIDFWGASFACGPQGEVLGQATHSEPEVILVDIDRRRTEQVRRAWPFFRDRRVQHYHSLTKLYVDNAD